MPISKHKTFSIEMYLITYTSRFMNKFRDFNIKINLG